MSTTTYTVSGMTCNGCATKVTNAVSSVPGVEESSVDLSAGTITVTGDHDAAQLRATITEAGYGTD